MRVFHSRFEHLLALGAERRAIYQLFPALVHLKLFGTAYQGMVARLISAVGI